MSLSRDAAFENIYITSEQHFSSLLRRLHATYTVDLEYPFPHIISITLFTFWVDTSMMTFSAKVLSDAVSLR